jgi:hypothetical protein
VATWPRFFARDPLPDALDVFTLNGLHRIFRIEAIPHYCKLVDSILEVPGRLSYPDNNNVSFPELQEWDILHLSLSRAPPTARGEKSRLAHA